MRYFLIALLAIFLSSACTTKNVFSALSITKEQEFAIENTRSGKIVFQNDVKGIYSLVYLNNIYKKIDYDEHQFYISIYLKDAQEDDISITLNKKYPIKTLKLENENKFTHLLAMKNNWISNYLVTFKDDGEKNINLVIDSGQFSSGSLKYVTNQR